MGRASERRHIDVARTPWSDDGRPPRSAPGRQLDADLFDDPSGPRCETKQGAVRRTLLNRCRTAGTVMARALSGRAMATTPNLKTVPRRTRSATAGSWLALLAATTLGDAAHTIRAEVRAKVVPSDSAMYRLVIQSYDRSDGAVPGLSARPVGSMQRSVTAEELRQGIHVNLLEIRESLGSGANGEKPLVVAWIDTGATDLEFDARRARPGRGSVYGVVARSAQQDAVQISLDRTVA